MTNPILFAIPLFFLLMLIEYLLGKNKIPGFYRTKDTITNLSIGIGNQVWNLFFKTILFGLYIYTYENHRFISLPESAWMIIPALVAFDFLFYWAHRWGHEVNLFWGAHVVHHQSEEYNLSVALRQSWFHNALAFFIFMPLPFLGIPPMIFGAAAAIDTLYQFWIHTRLIDKMPAWFEYIFNTPSHHRVHHAVNQKYIDKNYAGMFIVWDRMFGTFVAEDEKEPAAYGITTPLKSWDPVWANWHYYKEMALKAVHFKRVKEKLELLFARPGWLPSYLGGYQAPPPHDPEQKNKFETSVSPYVNAYAVFQFALTIPATMIYMIRFAELSLFYQVFIAVLFLFTGWVIGALYENKKWAYAAEYVRLAALLTCLNTLYYFKYTEWLQVMLIASGIGFVLFCSGFTITLLKSRQSEAAV